MDLNGGAYFITGSSGIGAATARMAAGRGASVFIASKTEEKCRALCEEIEASGGSCAFHAADLTDAASVSKAMEDCYNRFGRIDALFNVAGISARRFGDGPIHECTEEGWDLSFDANVKTAFLVSREALRRMMDQPVGANGLRGAILNCASILWFSPQPDHFATHAYAASKAALIGLTRAMASYYAPHKIRVNSISPGLVRTPMTKRSQGDPVILEFMKRKQPLSEGMIDAEAVAKAAMFLLSGDAEAVTGIDLPVGAGWDVWG